MSHFAPELQAMTDVVGNPIFMNLLALLALQQVGHLLFPDWKGLTDTIGFMIERLLEHRIAHFASWLEVITAQIAGTLRQCLQTRPCIFEKVRNKR
jgi:hypothetical protein